MKTLHALTAVLLLCVFATAAAAAPSIGDVDSKLRGGKRLTIKVEVTMEEPGEVFLEGDVNGVPVSVSKRFRRAGTRRLRLKVNAGRLGFRKRDQSLDFDLTIRATETGGEERTKDADLFVPLPMVFLHGFGGDLTDSGFSTFETALDLAMPDVYRSEGVKPNLVLFTYDSTGTSLAGLGADLERAVKKARRKTGFRKVDLVGHSMGGLVCRSYLARPRAAAKVRKCVMLATPNEGTPLAWLASLVAGFVTTDLLPEEFQGIAGELLDPAMTGQLRTFFPDYDWLEAGLLIQFALGDLSSPLTALNDIPPAEGVDFHALAYSSTSEEIGNIFGITGGTVVGIDLTEADLGALLGLISGTATGFSLDDIPLDVLVLGAGDGLVPLRSALMTDVPAWSEALTTHDLGIGIHGAMPADPRVLLKLRDILSNN